MYVEERIQVRRKKYKKSQHPPLLVLLTINECWSIGFVTVQQVIAGDFGFNIVDDYSREMVGQLATVSIADNQLARFLIDL